MQQLDPIRSAFMHIINRPYTDVLEKVSDLLESLARNDETLRAGLMGDIVCWWDLVPMDPAQTVSFRLPFTSRQRATAKQELESLISSGELVLDDLFEQNLSPPEVGALVIEQLQKARLHSDSELIEMTCLFRILSSNYVPYVGHVRFTDAQPISLPEAYAAALANPDELLILHSIVHSPNAFTALTAWAQDLSTRMESREQRALLTFAIGHMTNVARADMRRSLTQGHLPMFVRLGSPPDDDTPPDDASGSDPKQSN